MLMHAGTGIVIAMVRVLLPFMVLTLPLAVPGIVSGSPVVFALSISSFITPSLVGGVRLPVMAGSICQSIGAPAAIALSRPGTPFREPLAGLFLSPLLLPTLIFGIGLLMTISLMVGGPGLGGLVFALFIRAPGGETLAVRIDSQLEFSPDPGVAAVSPLMIAVSGGPALLIDRAADLDRMA